MMLSNSPPSRQRTPRVVSKNNISISRTLALECSFSLRMVPRTILATRAPIFRLAPT